MDSSADQIPGQEHKGKRIRIPVGLIDVMPTLLEAKRIAAPGKIHGRSMLDLLAAGKPARRPVMSTLFRSKSDPFVPGKVSIVSDGFKLIYSEPYAPSALVFLSTRRRLPSGSSCTIYPQTGERKTMFSIR